MAKKGWPYLWGPVAAVAGKKVAVEDVEVEEGSRTSLSPAVVRSAMPRRPTPSGKQWAGANAAGS
ncbi:unnamed protein product [Fusarium venenatum]|uniref:Uncharacterized protein n=1 Tax=Fusarium venenatum TaxID=56646 RepID=A0A2L2T9G9_9HYPO|nr:uncharacterized protein FVRRES_13539 [Fusarium venenatum]CEI41352.1 unnamed protein product [Fusarium venenatum]